MSKHSAPAGMKAYVDTFTIELGPASTKGTLVGVRGSGTSKPTFKYVSPSGDPVKQVYRDEAGNVFDVGDLSKATVTDDKELKVVDEEALAAAKKSPLPKDVMTLTVHQAADVEDHMFPSASNAYVFYPDLTNPSNKGWYDFILTAVQDRRIAFMATVNLRNYEGLYRLTSWRGHLVIQKMSYPEELNSHDTVEVKLSVADRKKALAMIDSLAVPFDIDTYRDATVARLQAVQDAALSGTILPKPVAEVPVFDLSAAMDAFEAFATK